MFFYSHTPITHTSYISDCFIVDQKINTLCVYPLFIMYTYFLSLFFIVSVSAAAASSFHFFLRYYQPLKPWRGIASIFLGKYKEFNSLSWRSS